MKKIYLTILLFFLLSTNAFAFITFKQSKDISDDTDDLRGIFIKPDGTRVYVTSDDATPTVIEYSLNVPFDISTATKTSSTFLTNIDKPHAIHFKSDGKVMYVVDNGSLTIEQYNLTTAWDTSTLVYDDNFTVSNEDQLRSLAFKYDGTRMYVTLLARHI